MVRDVGACLIDEACSDDHKAAFLTQWQERGEQAEEVAVLAEFFRGHARNPGLDAYAPRAIDIVGTGGDRAGTFNVSTTTALIVAAGGVPVIKHGNRSITSKTGSADLLESIGIPLQAPDSLLLASLEQHNFAFLFAPAYHPAFKAIVPVRKALASRGQKTVFNILGPLINPARPHQLLMGVYDADWVEPLAQVLSCMELRAGVVASSLAEGQPLDEIASVGECTIRPVGQVSEEDLQELRDLIARHATDTLGELKGGDAETNSGILRSVLSCEANRTLSHTLCINAAVAFRLVGKVDSLEAGYVLAWDLLKSGKVAEWVRGISAFYSSHA